MTPNKLEVEAAQRSHARAAVCGRQRIGGESVVWPGRQDYDEGGSGPMARGGTMCQEDTQPAIEVSKSERLQDSVANTALPTTGTNGARAVYVYMIVVSYMIVMMVDAVFASVHARHSKFPLG